MSNILEYTDTNFSRKIKQHEYAVVMFYAPWCGYCKKFEPEFEKAAKELNKHTPPIACVKVNCTDNGRDTCKIHNIFGYPTIKVFKNGNSEQYRGPRSEEGLISYMKEACQQKDELH